MALSQDSASVTTDPFMQEMTHSNNLNDRSYPHWTHPCFPDIRILPIPSQSIPLMISLGTSSIAPLVTHLMVLVLSLHLLLGFSPLINICFLTTQIKKKFISTSLGLSPVVHTLCVESSLTSIYIPAEPALSSCQSCKPLSEFRLPLFSQYPNFTFSPFKPPIPHKCRRPAKSCGGWKITTQTQDPGWRWSPFSSGLQ